MSLRGRRLLRRRRTVLIVVGALLLLVGLPLSLYRAFAPRDSVQLAATAYPALPSIEPKVYGPLLRMPLLVDGRLRVYAEQREVWAEQPATAKSSLTPYWSLRRWPQQVQGVVATGTTVVSLWSDGRLYGTDAHTGATLWWILTGAGHGSYTGRRTGATTVYAPPHLTTAGSRVIVGGDGGRILAIDVTQRATQHAQRDSGGGTDWSVADCPGQPYTVGGAVVCPGSTPGSSRIYRAADGAPLTWPVDPAGATPFGCGPANSSCLGLRAAGSAWLVGADGGLTEAAALASPDTWLAGDVVATQHADGTVTGAALADGRQLWRWVDPPKPVPPGTRPVSVKDAPPTRIVAQQAGKLHVITSDRDLVTLDPATGAEQSRFSLVAQDNRAFVVGHVYAAGGMVFIERLRPNAKPTDGDVAYYFSNPGVLATGS